MQNKKEELFEKALLGKLTPEDLEKYELENTLRDIKLKNNLKGGKDDV